VSRRIFYAEPARNGRAIVQGPTAEHLRRVLRAEPGQQYEISDGTKLYLAEIDAISKEAVEFVLLGELPARRLGADITLYAALVKFDHFEWMIEKAAELGVKRLVPVAAARSEKGLDVAALKRVERWRRIAEESGQQARRVSPIGIAEPCTLSAALRVAGGSRLFLDEECHAPLLAHLTDRSSNIHVLSGPEGGWTEKERSEAAGSGWNLVSLGELILRAETAALAAVSMIQGWWWTQA
jgi:16S rRNA (uracil1498-N3)-methyltransferase